MTVYAAEDVVFTIDSQQVNCLTGITLEDVITLEKVKTGDVAWSRRVVTIQSWQISLSGEGREGYILLRGMHRSRATVQVSISTTDAEIVQQGAAIVLSVNRQVDPEKEIFSATLLGIGDIDGSVARDYLLIEDGDRLLQEDAGRIII